MKTRSILFIVSLPWLCFIQTSQAQTSECEQIGEVVSAQGTVRIQHPNSDQWANVSRKTAVCEGDIIETGSRSRAAVNLNNESVLRIKQRSQAKLENFAARSEARSLMRLITGVIHFFSRKPNEYAISTTTATIGIRGTEFVVSVDSNSTEVTVFEGTVQAENDVAPIALGGGETVSIVSGQTLRAQALVSPRDQVQWSLYYPPLLSLGKAGSETLAAAGQCAQSGDFDCAFDNLDAFADGDRDALYFTFLAALLLAVGDIEQARESLQQARATTSENAEAQALEAIIALTQNRTDEAMQSALAAVEIDAESAAALISLSYVQQAATEIDAAVASLRTAVDHNPENPLAWARLSELLLAQGQNTESGEAAARAVELDANLSRGHMVRGYAALGRIDADAAIDAFETALGLDSADPMAHLGLGLGLIRNGDLVAGRREIEAAVALDSSSALLRPYLGRAYYEEKRAPLDADQYAIARQLDPNDPTAYLFDALRKHSENRPVEASRDLRESIARNDNRAVYRGRNLLDQDRAARGASLARIYDTLGFSDQGIDQATKSLSADPANASAHRFLSDSYQQVRRREVSRVSELFQAQMLQDINNNPVQPSVSAANLNIGSGAGDIGLNEFSGLFESNDVQPSVSLQSGSNDTTAVEAVLSGVYDSLSFSIGAFDYETDGWRENNAQDQELGNLFLQWAAAPQLNLQVELSSRESTEGDLAFNFDPDEFDSSFSNDKDLDSGRVGLHYSPTAQIDILVSHIESEREELQRFNDLVIGPPFVPNPACIANGGFLPCPPFPAFIPTLTPGGSYEVLLEEDGSQDEIQYQHKFALGNLVIGYAEADFDSTLTTATVPSPSFPEGVVEDEIEQTRSYLYFTSELIDGLELTIGASDDEYDRGPVSLSETSSKFGLRWQFTANQSIRLAAFEALKPALVNNRSLEPTQIVGFNQLFDDPNGTEAETVGFGYDIALSGDMLLGLETTSREMLEPTVVNDPVAGPIAVLEERDEDINRIYFNWTPTNTISFTAGVIYDRYKADPSDTTLFDGLPERVKTVSLPISIMYFSPGGWYGGVTVSSIEQEVVRNVDPGATASVARASGDDEFEVIDLSFGYRLTNRMGSVSLEIQNAADEEFMYQDDSFREFSDEPSTGPYFPQRTAFIRANLVF
ncbi:MAG: TonB-dependent receptor [Gammaproteobacteria bacterium]|nr:TonB-dependent receptor [Gammaproteobacteria bacterium]